MSKQTVDQALLAMKTLQAKGDLTAARALGRDMLARYPANSRLRASLAALDQTKARAPIAPNPPRPEMEMLVTLFANQQNAAVIDHARRLAQRYPQSAMLHNIIGSAATRLAQSDLAYQSYHRALALDPTYIDALNNLGTLQIIEAKWPEAVDSFSRSVAAKPDQPDALNSLGLALGNIGQPYQAVDRQRAAVALAPQNPDILHKFGKALLRIEDFAAALDVTSRASALTPDDAEIWLTMARIHVMMNQRPQAELAFATALNLGAGPGMTLREWSMVHKFTPDDPLITTITAHAAATGMTLGDRCHLTFARAKVAEDLGDLSTAYDLLVQGNHLRRSQTQYSIDQDISQFDRLQRSAPALARQSLPLATAPIATIPVFIVAMPRSGTSLVEQIISSHSQVAGGGELNFLPQIGYDLASGAQPASRAALRKVRQDYLSMIAGLSHGRAFLTDKMPHNFRLIPLIRAALPEARIIHIRRDPGAVCWSNFKQFFTSSGLQYCYDLRDLTAFYRLYATMMDRWHATYGDHIYTLDYDRLTTDQEGETRKLIAHIGLEWEDACLSPDQNKRLVRTASQHQVKQAVYQGSSAEWHKYAPFLNGAFDDLPK